MLLSDNIKLFMLVYLAYELNSNLTLGIYIITPSIQICLSYVPFWDVPKYCFVFKNRSY